MKITHETFQKIRVVYNCSMREFGDLLNISAGYVNDIEKERKPLTVPVKARLIDELQLNHTKLNRILEIYQEFKEGRIT
ncbi:helix-turn-helix domain-containing protein [Pseudalkalibacillus sp. NRS-1564]|uniref:helix-turn-helix domain-containing protein n=1 Tax=Pseudalkalibacillus sp. NRS-1564 TaxID=3233900 RepID=UPI003D2C7AF6